MVGSFDRIEPSCRHAVLAFFLFLAFPRFSFSPPAFRLCRCRMCVRPRSSCGATCFSWLGIRLRVVSLSFSSLWRNPFAPLSVSSFAISLPPPPFARSLACLPLNSVECAVRLSSMQNGRVCENVFVSLSASLGCLALDGHVHTRFALSSFFPSLSVRLCLLIRPLPDRLAIASNTHIELTLQLQEVSPVCPPWPCHPFVPSCL